MLMQIRAITQAGRALAYYASAQTDLAHHAESEQDCVSHQRRVDLVIPIVKGWCTEMAQEATYLGVQVHGGMGYTWEVPAHHYLKRAWVLENVFGTGSEHASRVGERLES